jgi:hypothetical protein
MHPHCILLLAAGLSLAADPGPGGPEGERTAGLVRTIRKTSASFTRGRWTMGR